MKRWWGGSVNIQYLDFFKILNKCRNIIDHPETSLPSNITFEKPFNTHEQPDAGQGWIGYVRFFFYIYYIPVRGK